MRSQSTTNLIDMQPGDRQYFASQHIFNLSFTSAIRRRNPEGLHLFTGTIEVATRYNFGERPERYCVEFTRAAHFVDLREHYDWLVSLEPRLAGIAFPSVVDHVPRWVRKSRGPEDAYVFNSLAAQMPDYDGISISLGGNLHSEHVLFDRGHCVIYHCSNGWTPDEDRPPTPSRSSSPPSDAFTSPSASTEVDEWSEDDVEDLDERRCALCGRRVHPVFTCVCPAVHAPA